MFGIDFPVVSTGNLFTSIDGYVANGTGNINGTSTLTNGGYNTPGALYAAPLPQGLGVAAKGVGSSPFVKYVRYNPTASQAILTGPALVYWKDVSRTVVTPLQSEAVFAGPNAIAGWLMYNTTSKAGATAADINGNWCFIFVGGYLPQAVAVVNTAVGDVLIGGATAFTPARIAANAAITNVIAGIAQGAVANGLADVYVPLLN